MKFILSIYAAFALGGPATAAQPAYIEDLDKIDDVNPYVIKSVMVDGNKLISRGEIKAVITTKQGDFFHRKDMEADMKAIAKLGYFDVKDLHITAETTAAGMVIHIKVKENPFFKSIAFSGNTVVPTAKMAELFKTQLQKPQNTTQIAAALKTIVNDYKDQGYLLAHATVAKSDAAGNITVKVDEGIVQDIDLSALNDEQKTTLQNVLTIKAGDTYNEKVLAAELKSAYKSGKFSNLEREVIPIKGKSGAYVLTIKAGAAEAPKLSSEEKGALSLMGSKGKSSMPVLHKLIKSKSTIYRDGDAR